jgi:hypothetical protein
MITIHWFGLFAIFIMVFLLGLVAGTKTSADRWIEYKEWKAWKGNKK